MPHSVQQTLEQALRQNYVATINISELRSVSVSHAYNSRVYGAHVVLNIVRYYRGKQQPIIWILLFKRPI